MITRTSPRSWRTRHLPEPVVSALRRGRRAWKRAQIRAGLRHLHGPAYHTLRDDQAAVIVLGQNTAFHLPRLVAHHRTLGIEHFVLLDNASTDRSVECAADLGMIVVSCDLAFRDFQMEMRHAATMAFCRGGWRLVVDSDELFDYPGAAQRSLPEVLAWLNARGQTAVVAQMLDLVPEDGLTEALDADYDQAIAACSWYDLSNLEARAYFDPDLPFAHLLARNSVTEPRIPILFGGIRRTLFGEDCCLSKHPLFRPGPGIDAAPHPHVVSGVRCAEFSALLRHYKFTNGFRAREADRVRRRALSHNEADLRMRTLESTAGFSFWTPGRARAPTAEHLLEAGLLVASDAARGFLSA